MSDIKTPADRRDFFKKAAAFGAAGVLSQHVSAKPATTPSEITSATRSTTSFVGRSEEADVVVIGGGFAGLTAANRLKHSGKKVVLLEARDRLGGRTKTEQFLNGVPLDVGGQWVGPSQDYVLRLIEYFKLPTFETYDDGLNVIESEIKNGNPIFHTYKAKPGLTTQAAFSMFKGTALDFSALYDGLDKLAKTVNLQAPWLTANASHYDAMTFETWIDEQVTKVLSIKIKSVDPRIKNLFRSVMHTVFSADPAKISMLHAMFYVKSGGGLDSLINVTNGAQQTRLTNGTEALVNKLSETISESVRLNQPVRTIKQNAKGVEVYTDNLVVRAERVIVAMPPTLAGRIRYEPILSADRDQLTQSVPMGSVIKVLAMYEKPFWRKDAKGPIKGDLSGQAFSPFRAITATFDNSHPDFPYGILVGFIIGPNAEKYRRVSATDRKKAALESLAHFYGSQALKPLHYEDHNWAEEEWTRGCYVGYMPPGIWTSLGKALKQPEGRIHWAGTETSDVWAGYIEGAIRSGYRVAREILDTK